MPFKSEKQRRFLWLKHPDIAKRWAGESKAGESKTHTNALKRRLKRSK